MNQPLFPAKQVAPKEKINDIAFRLILIPFFGIAVPLITGMIDRKNFGHWQYKLSFLYTILIAFMVWQGNRYLLFTMRNYFNWFNKPVKKIIALLMAISFYTIPLSLLMLTSWYHLFAHGQVNWNTVFMSTLIIMICVIFITHVYETVFLVKHSESEILKNEQLERAKAQAELESLKNQIDPHFIFNSLNTLSHLIDEDPAKAKQFNDNLANVYRYILRNKREGLVLLRDEMTFLLEYFSLLKIRFEKAVDLQVGINDDQFDQYLIPPISLQVLMENAIKHNEFSALHPLVVDVFIKDGELHFHNELRPKILRKTSSRTGLHNLGERYRLTTDNTISITNDEKKFMVVLPVLKIA